MRICIEDVEKKHQALLKKLRDVDSLDSGDVLRLIEDHRQLIEYTRKIEIMLLNFKQAEYNHALQKREIEISDLDERALEVKIKKR